MLVLFAPIYCVTDAVRKEANMVVAEFRKLGIAVNKYTDWR